MYALPVTCLGLSTIQKGEKGSRVSGFNGVSGLSRKLVNPKPIFVLHFGEGTGDAFAGLRAFGFRG